MGADLYLKSTYEPNHARWSDKFNEWVEIRDALRNAGKSTAADDAQKKVTKYFNKMYALGYFRDSYNDSSILWLFDLSWWTDVGALFDSDSKLTPEKADTLLEVLKDREPIFEANVKKVVAEQGPKAKTYFVQKYEELK